MTTTTEAANRDGRFGTVDDPAIQSLVQHLENLVENNSNKKHFSSSNLFVQEAFEWVRDEVAYTWELDWTATASETLQRRQGNCFNKACLLVTVLRARGIPADYAVATTPLTSPLIDKMAPDWCWSHFPNPASPHSVVMVPFGESQQWIILDPTVDTSLAQGMQRMGNNTAVSASHWDGIHHAVHHSFLSLQPKRHANIDFLLAKKPSYRPALVVLMEESSAFLRRLDSNDKIRKNAPPATVQRALEQHLFNFSSPAIVSSAVPLPSSSDRRDALVAEYDHSYNTNGQSSGIFCNHNHPDIQRLAKRLRRRSGTGTDGSNREFARAAFAFVRDHVEYTLQSDWTVPVEHTLALRRGMCSTKACLLTALLRAGGLRAGFFLQPQNPLQHMLVPSWIAQFYSSNSIHVLSAVQFESSSASDSATSTWIKLDPYLDGNLARSMDAAGVSYEAGYPCFYDFDGYHDALNYHDPGDMVLRTTHIDDFMVKKSRIPQAVLQCHNICLELLRYFGPIFSSRQQVLDAMEHHLLTFHPQLVAEVQAAALRKRKYAKNNNMNLTLTPRAVATTIHPYMQSRTTTLKAKL